MSILLHFQLPKDAGHTSVYYWSVCDFQRGHDIAFDLKPQRGAAAEQRWEDRTSLLVLEPGTNSLWSPPAECKHTHTRPVVSDFTLLTAPASMWLKIVTGKLNFHLEGTGRAEERKKKRCLHLCTSRFQTWSFRSPKPPSADGTSLCWLSFCSLRHKLWEALCL